MSSAKFLDCSISGRVCHCAPPLSSVPQSRFVTLRADSERLSVSQLRHYPIFQRRAERPSEEKKSPPLCNLLLNGDFRNVWQGQSRSEEHTSELQSLRH